MKMTMHGQYADGSWGIWVLEGTLKEIKTQAREIVEKRKLIDYWAEELEDK